MLVQLDYQVSPSDLVLQSVAVLYWESFLRCIAVQLFLQHAASVNLVYLYWWVSLIKRLIADFNKG